MSEQCEMIKIQIHTHENNWQSVSPKVFKYPEWHKTSKSHTASNHKYVFIQAPRGSANVRPPPPRIRNRIGFFSANWPFLTDIHSYSSTSHACPNRSSSQREASREEDMTPSGDTIGGDASDTWSDTAQSTRNVAEETEGPPAGSRLQQRGAGVGHFREVGGVSGSHLSVNDGLGSKPQD